MEMDKKKRLICIFESYVLKMSLKRKHNSLLPWKFSYKNSCSPYLEFSAIVFSSINNSTQIRFLSLATNTERCKTKSPEINEVRFDKNRSLKDSDIKIMVI